MARLPSTPDCAIKGCTRARHKAQMCKEHYSMVPMSMAIGASTKAMLASMKAAKAEHRKMLAYVRRALADGTAKKRPKTGYMGYASAAFASRGERAASNYRNAPRIPRP
jgi:hypothetical protein